MSAGIQVEVDRDLCQGSGCCTRTAAGVFEIDSGPDAVAMVRGGEGLSSGPTVVPAEYVEQVMDAAAECPAGAINFIG